MECSRAEERPPRRCTIFFLKDLAVAANKPTSDNAHKGALKNTFDEVSRRPVPQQSLRKSGTASTQRSCFVGQL